MRMANDRAYDDVFLSIHFIPCICIGNTLIELLHPIFFFCSILASATSFFFAFRFEASFGIQRFFFPREMKIASNTINRFIFFSAYCFAQVNARNSNLSQYFCFYILITPQRCLTESPRHFFIYSIWRISTLLQLVRSSLSQQRVEIISNFTRWSYIYIWNGDHVYCIPRRCFSSTYTANASSYMQNSVLVKQNVPFECSIAA